MITLLNIIRIIYSHVVVNKYKDTILDSTVLEKIIEECDIKLIKNYEICMWITYLHTIGEFQDWNPYQMFREIFYHKKLSKYCKLKNTSTTYSTKQTLKVRVERILGNCLY